jgi:KDO2-lipid IV(A) lauroyltransferase
MSRKQSPVVNYAVYVAARLAVCLFQFLSNRGGHYLVAGLAWLAYIVDKRHRLIALENLRQAFPDRPSDALLKARVLATYRYLFTLMMEISQLPRKMHRHNSEYYFDLGPKEETILSLLRSDRALLIITGHFGNWELAGYGLGARGFQTYAVSRPLDNPYLETFLRRVREQMGQTMLAKKDLPAIQATLARGGKIAMLADQNAGPRGLMVSFFGRDAPTEKGIAVLALQYQAPMLVVGVRKVAEPMRYRVVVEDIIFPEEYSGFRAEAVRRITQRYTAALERVIRSAPEQYFWLHNRWKHHPQPERDSARAA